MKTEAYKILPKDPILLAPLAGVSDAAFRLMCERNGADLTYVEMLSSAALIYGNQKTRDMLFRLPEEKNVGVQLTGRNADEIAQGVEILNPYGFKTIDINMGCPVKKVVKVGCGSALLKDAEKVYEVTRKAVAASSVPLSVKIRLGWDMETRNFMEVVDAIEKSGAVWVTVHGRTRSQNYSDPVDLEALRKIKEQVNIPLIGNGNLFTETDAQHMKRLTDVDGLMVSRGSLGNPWSFAQMKGECKEVTLDQWYELVKDHIRYHRMIYKTERVAMVCFRKHLLWYLKGWPYASSLKEQVVREESFDRVFELLDAFVANLQERGITHRFYTESEGETESKFVLNPKNDICLEDYRTNKVATCNDF